MELLNGKHVEVSCRSDAVASEIADVVMRHMNFNENSFFGLTVLRGLLSSHGKTVLLFICHDRCY